MFDSSGILLWSSYFGGKKEDVGLGITFDHQGCIIAVGSTSSSDFPVTDNAFQKNNAGNNDGYIVKFCGCETNINALVWIPDTIAYYGDKEYHLPVYLIVDTIPNDNVLESFTTEISFDADLFIPDRLTKGVILENNVVGGVRKIKIRVDNIILTSNKVLITEIIGDVPFSKKNMTIMELANMSWNEPCIETEKKDGLFQVDCEYILNTLIWIPDTTVKIGITDFRMPVYLDAGNLQNETYLDSITFEVCLDTGMFTPTNVTKGVILNNRIAAGKRFLEIKVDSIEIKNKQTLLTEIIGKIQVTKHGLTTFQITKQSYEHPCLIMQAQEGKLRSGCDVSAFYFPDFTSIENLNVLAVHLQEKKTIQLTPATSWSRGAVWYDEKVPVKNGFSTTFSFRMFNAYNDFDDGSIPGADGIVFVIQNYSPKAIGTAGGGIGYEGIANCLAVEFDTYVNKVFNDPNGNHVAVFSQGVWQNICDHDKSANLGTNPLIIQLIPDSTIYYAKIEYNTKPNTLQVYIDSTDKFASPVLEVDSLDLGSLLNLEEGCRAYVGITSATGNSWEVHELLSWTICPFPCTSVGVKDNVIIPDELNIYPNPADDKVIVEFYKDKPGFTELSIYNIYGQEITKFMYDDISYGKNQIEWKTNGIESGIYYFKLTTEKTNICKKVVIIK